MNRVGDEVKILYGKLLDEKKRALPSFNKIDTTCLIVSVFTVIIITILCYFVGKNGIKYYVAYIAIILASLALGYQIGNDNIKPFIVCVSIVLLPLTLGFQIGTIYWYNVDIYELTKIAEDVSLIEKECKRRDDLVPNLISITKDYAQHERELFRYVSEARSILEPFGKNSGTSDVPKSADLQKILSKLVMLSEQYPELKAVQSYEDLMEMIATTENRIAEMRSKYITSCQSYNSCNQSFWCYFFTFYIPMPNYIEYYHAEKSQMPLNCGRWQYVENEDELIEKWIGEKTVTWIVKWRKKSIQKAM